MNSGILLAADLCTRKAPAERPSVLVVDDEPNILSALRRLLRREPYDLRCANSAAAAMTMLEQQPADLVMTDYRMPGDTGVDLLRHVQQRWPHTIRIVLSGYSEVRAVIAAINDGAIYKFLTKPWNDEELKLNLRRAIEGAGLASENRRLADEVVAQNAELRRLNKLLDQRATDASRGLQVAQVLLEAVDVAVLVADESGLIVFANREARAMLSAPAGTVVDALPPPVADAFRLPPPNGGDCEIDGLDQRLAWRTRRLEASGDTRGVVMTFWRRD